ncbi:MAG: metallophosphoesterase [Tissierellales bacterium]|nr:metallophosphoesterase [Tissierellales bacterium]
MRIAVISDTHRITNSIIEELKDKSYDLIIHLGDFIKDAEKIEEILEVEIIKIKGNCDFREFDGDEEIIRVFKNKKFLITHGHRYRVKYNLDNLFYRAKELEVDGVLFGHTHNSFNENIEGVIFFNPGSPSNPRGSYDKTYGIIEIDDFIDSKIIHI